MVDTSITFSFGENWRDYVDSVTDENIVSAKSNIHAWLGRESIVGKSVVDVGCGSGIHSLSYLLLGANSVYSFDADAHSVDATKILWEKSGKPSGWTISSGSVLDDVFIKSLGQFDIVYSWGVLHHTGNMWKAIENAATLVKPGGIFWITIYQKGPEYARDLALKKRFNAAPELGKKIMIASRIVRLMLKRLRRFQNPLTWNRKGGRGMDAYHDLIDWLGGLPYEVASESEIVKFARRAGLVLDDIQVRSEGSCSYYIFTRVAPADTKAVI